jgi:2-methylisocitrate lyase-like PEP mutase family enzyme
MNKRQNLRQQLRNQECVIAPGVYDCLSAKIAEQAGFGAVMVSGAGVSASLLGVPDLGLLTFTESLMVTRAIVNATSAAVIADCDTGYGNPGNVYRTVREVEQAGVAALFLEDQVSPKKCGHFSGKEVIPALEMCQKLAAAVEARTDPDLLIIARTDARAIEGPEKALERARAYVKAGADAIFIEAPLTREELANNVSALADLGIPLMANMAEGGKTPLLTGNELAELGYGIVTFPGALQKTALWAMELVAKSMQETSGVAEFYPDRMMSLGQRSALLGLSEHEERDRRLTNTNQF